MRDQGKYKLLQQLLPWIERYENSKGKHDESSVEDFNRWLSGQLSAGYDKEVVETTGRKADRIVEGEIAQLVSMLYRYAKLYIKKALRGSELQTLDDFGYLIYLLNEGSMTKAALITKNIHEIPSGTEVIKRLIRKGWIDEKDDEKDKRSVRVSINEKGRQVLFSVFPRFTKVALIVAGQLDAAEKTELLRLLKKLDTFHHAIFTSQRSLELDEILSIYGLTGTHTTAPGEPDTPNTQTVSE